MAQVSFKTTTSYDKYTRDPEPIVYITE